MDENPLRSLIGYFPHPGDPTLAATYPHHKHVPPDIKHHRIPAPGLSYETPNLALILDEVQDLIHAAEHGASSAEN